MNIARLQKHLEEVQNTIYIEPDIEYHRVIIDSQIDKLHDFKDVLDVGFGTGYSLKKFKEKGFNVTGITMNPKELEGFENVFYMDMCSLDFEDKSFDLVWCRHSLEHSLIPFITLLEFKRVLKDGGKLYVEVPSDNILHIENPNHYSLFADHTWLAIFRKAGFRLFSREQAFVSYHNINDIYWQYWLE